MDLFVLVWFGRVWFGLICFGLVGYLVSTEGLHARQVIAEIHSIATILQI